MSEERTTLAAQLITLAAGLLGGGTLAKLFEIVSQGRASTQGKLWERVADLEKSREEEQGRLNECERDRGELHGKIEGMEREQRSLVAYIHQLLEVLGEAAPRGLPIPWPADIPIVRPVPDAHAGAAPREG